MSKNIKEIGKELLGKSLNSFHRKTGLTKLEKNNEMQDGILNGILSQVDDAYIEKTDQSNVIHLEGSGDGVVVLDSIEGNTLVNLWEFNNLTDGYFVSNNGDTFTNFFTTNVTKIKPNQKYTFITEIVENTLAGNSSINFINDDDGQSCFSDWFRVSAGEIGVFKTVLTTKSDLSNAKIVCRSYIHNHEGTNAKVKVRCILIEGEHLNKEMNYFKGLQSSFEEKVNNEGKYEIEILSNNKNLIPKEYLHSMFRDTVKVDKDDKITVLNNDGNGGYKSLNNKFIYAKPNSKLRFHAIFPQGTTLKGVALFILDDNNNQIFFNASMSSNSYVEFTVPSNGRFKLGMSCKYQDTSVGDFYIMLTTTKEGVQTKYTPNKHNKIKLLINEPLRSGVTKKDNLCVIDNKLYIERNTKQLIFDGSRNWIIASGHENICHARLPQSVIGKDIDLTAQNSKIKGYCDKLSLREHGIWNQDIEGIHTNNSPNFDNRALFINIKRATVGGNTSEILKAYLSNNPIKFVIETYEPVYEEVVNEYGEPILLEGYENGTIYIDSIIIPTTTVRYTPKMESFKTLNEVSDNNTMLANDINDNIIPYMMDVDLMIMEKEMALMSHKNIRTIGVKDMTSMQKRTQDMLERLIKGKTLTEQECKTRVAVYLNAGKITDEQAKELNFLTDEIYA